MDSNTLEKHKEIVNEWVELLKHMKDWLDLGRFKSEVMAELNVSAFEDLPQSVRRFIVIRHAALVPTKEIAARKEALEQLQQEILAGEIANLPGWRDSVN
jgi:hypothetical protein